MKEKIKLDIKKMQQGEAESIRDIIIKCYYGLAKKLNLTKHELEQLIANTSIESILNNMQNCESYSVKNGLEIIGYLSIEKNDIAQLFVRPDYQNQGVGAILFKYAENVIKNNGFQKLTVYTGTSAENFYLKMGAKITEIKTCDQGPLTGRPLVYLEKHI